MLWPRGAWVGSRPKHIESSFWDLAADLPLVFETVGGRVFLYKFGAVFITKFFVMELSLLAITPGQGTFLGGTSLPLSMECKACGCDFAEKDRRHRYCGAGCRASMKKRAPLLERPCQWCGASFAAKGRVSRYCGEECGDKGAAMNSRAGKQKRRAHIKNAVCDGHTRGDLSVYWLEQGFIACVLQGPDCDVFYEHMDHLTPLSRGGSHTLENLVPACGRCNMQKSAKTYEEWLVFVNRRRRAKVN